MTECNGNIFDDDVFDAVHGPTSPEYGEVENKRSWKMPSCSATGMDTTPLRKLLTGGNHLPSHQELILPANKCKQAIKDFCSPPRSKKKSRRQRFSLGGRCDVVLAPNNTCGEGVGNNDSSNSREEDVSQVYENVEILLDALRMERHQEKLVKEMEIGKLQEKIAFLEQQVQDQDQADKKDLDEEKAAAGVDQDITETLLETLAMLEDECEEWQTKASRRKSMGKGRTSLETILTKTDDEDIVPQAESTGSPSAEEKIIESVHRLKTKEFIPDEDRKLLTWYLMDENKQDGKNFHANVVASLRKKIKVLERELLQKDLEMSKERASLRQEIFQKELELRELRKWASSTSTIAATSSTTCESEADNDDSVDCAKKTTNKDATAACDSDEAGDSDVMDKKRRLRKLEDFQKELGRKQRKLDTMKHSQEGEEDNISVGDKENHDTNTSNELEGKKLELTKEKNLEEKVKHRMSDLEQTLNRVQRELSGTQRKNSDVLMKLAVESTSKASLSIKLDSAMAQIEKQKQAIDFLNHELGQAKYDCNMYAKKVHDLSTQVGASFSEYKATHGSSGEQKQE